MNNPETTNDVQGSGRPSVAIILAAGQSARMKTDLPKALHEVCGRPMLAYVIDACKQAGCGTIYCVVGYGSEQVIEKFADTPDIVWVQQAEQKGTGHAVMCCKEYLKDFQGDCVVAFSDGPLVLKETIGAVMDHHSQEQTVLTMGTGLTEDPTGYGRVFRDKQGKLIGIIEQAHCTAEQLKIKEINPSYYCYDCQTLFWALDQVRPDNPKNEYYLTDAVRIILQSGRKAQAITIVPPIEVFSINSRQDLAHVSKLMQVRIQETLMDQGVTIVAPENTWIDSRAQIGIDSVIYPFTCIIGQVNIGTRVNIAAGTTIANYDDTQRQACSIGDDCWIGAGSVLIAPLTLEAGRRIEPGTVIKHNDQNKLPVGNEALGTTDNLR